MPNAAEAQSFPTLFSAEHTYEPVSSTEKSRILNVPLITELLPFGKPTKERVHVMTDGG